jgi:DNA transposition AAA+ family ATPase
MEYNLIAKAAKSYMADKKISQAELSGKSGVNPSYLSNMINGIMTVKSGEKQVEIGRQHWHKLATFIGYQMDDETMWELVHTSQFKRIITELTMAKETGETKTLIGAPGCGKTYSIKKFEQNFPLHTYVITVNSLVRVTDVINFLLKALDLPVTGSWAVKLVAIITKLRDIKRKGGSPIIIFDEAENMDKALMRLIKGMFDGIMKYASIVLVGTDQLITKMDKLKMKNTDGAPQFYRRFKSGIRKLAEMDGRYTLFFEKYEVEPGLRRLLCQICNNYGELADYLEPALNECAAKGVVLTEQQFRIKYDMPR